MRLLTASLVACLAASSAVACTSPSDEAQSSEDNIAESAPFTATDLSMLLVADTPTWHGDWHHYDNYKGNRIAREIVRAASDLNEVTLHSEAGVQSEYAMAINSHKVVSLVDLLAAMGDDTPTPNWRSQPPDEVETVGKLLAYARTHGYNIDLKAGIVNVPMKMKVGCEEKSIKVAGHEPEQTEAVRTVQSEMSFTIVRSGIYYGVKDIKMAVPTDPSLAYFELFGAIDATVPMDISGYGVKQFEFGTKLYGREQNGSVTVLVATDGDPEFDGWSYPDGVSVRASLRSFASDDHYGLVTCTANVPF